MDLLVDRQGVLDAALVEGEVAETDRAHRPALGLRQVAQQDRRLLARLPVADRRRAQREHAGGHRRQLRRVVRLGEGDRLEARRHRGGERAPVLHDGARAEHADQRTHRAAGAQVGVEVVEQGVGGRGAAQERHRRGQHLGEEQGVGREAGVAGDLGVAIEQRLAAGLAAGDAQGPGHDVDAPLALLVDTVAHRHRLLDGVGHVGERAVADVGGEGVEQQVDGDVRLDTVDLGRGGPQQGDRLGRAALRRRDAAAQLLAADALDHVVGVGVLGDDGVGPVEQPPGGGRHAGVEHRDGGHPQPADAVGRLGREPAGELPRPGGGGRRAALVRRRSRRPRGPGRRSRRARPRRAPGARPGPATRPAASGASARWAARRSARGASW